MTRSVHPEATSDEIWIGNIWAVDFPAVGWKSKRLGKVAYFNNGKRIASGNKRPVFALRSEVEASGVAIPDKGAIDHKW